MSKIEQIITEIEEYIDSCRFQPLSTTKIIVNKDEIDELLAELRLRTPDEIKKYQKIIANKDAILGDAKDKAETMIAEATAHITELVSEHEIMQQAYKEANEIIEKANAEAGSILENATIEANDLKTNAVAYTDKILEDVQNILSNGIDTFQKEQNELLSSMSDSLQVVISNRNELRGTKDEAQEDDDYEDYTVNFDE